VNCPAKTCHDLSLSAVAREFCISTNTISSAIRDGELPAYRLPGQRRFRILREDVLSWIRSNPIVPNLPVGAREVEDTQSLDPKGPPE
jgi:excisionase family DNA binding protein